MDQLIATYLFMYKQCALPGMGNLAIVNKAAENDFVSKKIIAPYPTILFSDKEIATDDFVQFIATQKNISTDDAYEELKNYCDQIKSTLDNNNSFSIEPVGVFSISPDAAIHFQEQQLPSYYLPVAITERVVHPQAEHAILVGDKESTNTAMADFFNEEEPVKKSQWWIWAVLLFCIAIVMILTYFNSANNTGMFGNCMGIF